MHEFEYTGPFGPLYDMRLGTSIRPKWASRRQEPTIRTWRMYMTQRTSRDMTNSPRSVTKHVPNDPIKITSLCSCQWSELCIQRSYLLQSQLSQGFSHRCRAKLDAWVKGTARACKNEKVLFSYNVWFSTLRLSKMTQKYVYSLTNSTNS